MTDLKILEYLVKGGARYHDVEEERAMALLKRVLAAQNPTPLANRTLFYELATTLGHSDKVLYTTGRANKLKARLKVFTPEKLLQAAEIIAGDPFLQGDNDGAKKYGNIDYLLRKDEIIDNLIADVDPSTQVSDLTKVEIDI